MTSELSAAFTGSCRCKHVTYQSDTLPTSLTACYCATCRRVSGSHVLIFMSLPISSITWTSGTSSFTTTSYSDMATRTHCGKCGTPISMAYVVEPDVISVTLGSVDEDTVKGEFPKVGQHIFVDERGKLGGFEIPQDGVVRHARFNEKFEKVIDNWRVEKGEDK